MAKEKITNYIITTVVFVLIGISLFVMLRNYIDKRRAITAIIKVDLIDNLNIPVFSEIKVSECIKNINGKIVDDYYLDTTDLGQKKISFKYINEEKIEIPYSFYVRIIDYNEPFIKLGESYNVNVGYDGSLLEDIMCADNYDDKPKCEIVGEYDTSKEGTYFLKMVASDSSGNKNEKSFKLVVSSPQNGSSNNYFKNFSDIKARHKKENTKVGIDISSWQGEIDFSKLKNAGVEFAIIRIGSTKGISGKYFLDSTFIRNIEGLTENNIPVGVYFYSYAKNKKEAQANAEWVIKNLKNYNLSLPIFYDWENWEFYNKFNLSFYHLTENALEFIKVVEKNGYTGGLYSSKYYLNNVWSKIQKPVWVAHYTDDVSSYENEYVFWQICNNGKVDGIDGFVDIDIMYN